MAHHNSLSISACMMQNGKIVGQKQLLHSTMGADEEAAVEEDEAAASQEHSPDAR
jgi:hypothetical protein